MDDHLDLLLLDRYFAGQCTSAERQQLASWIAADPRRQVEVEAYQHLVAQIKEQHEDGGDTDAFWERLSERLSVHDASPAAARDRLLTGHTRPLGARSSTKAWGPEKRSRVLRYAAAAAVMFFMLGLGVLVSRGVHVAGGPGGVREYATGAGQRETVMLPDGTHFTLAPASTLRVPRAYGRAMREVSLEGEAYFSVVHDAAQPFVVRTQNALTTDVGTSFDVRAYRDDTPVRVAVVEGRVLVRASDRRVPGAAGLSAGDLATVSVNGTPIVTHGADVTSLTAWSQGHLIFVDTPLRDALPELSRWFDIEILTPDPLLAGAHLTASFRDEPVSDVLATLAGALGARYERVGRIVTLRLRTPRQ